MQREVNNMQELEGLIKEGKHVEFVEWFNSKDREKNEAKKNKDITKAKSIENEIKKALSWSENYIKNKEILPLSEQQLVDYGCVLGVYLKIKGLKTTQIRKMLDRFNRIEEEFDINKLIKLKPILAYTAARNKETKELVKILDNSIGKINNFDDFKKICDFLKGVVAYHRLGGGD